MAQQYSQSPYGQPYEQYDQQNNQQYGQQNNQQYGQQYDQQNNQQFVSPQQSVLSNGDFLKRVETVKADILSLTSNVGKIGTLHQSILGDPYNTRSGELESLITQTQVLNTSIKDQIKFLETDAARSKGNPVKDTQVKQLKNSFNRQLQDYRSEEATYERQYRDQIKRQYEIVNPEASEAEKEEAANADWGNEGVFQTALKTNRSATANSVLGSVRARHNDIQKIEQTIMELNRLMEDLATAVVVQEEPIQQNDERAAKVRDDMEQGNTQLDQGIASARRARKMKFWCLGIAILIVVILAAVLGAYFGTRNK